MRKAAHQIPLDTDALNADSLKAALICAVEVFETACERGLIVPDWSKVELAIHHDRSPEGGTSLIVVRTPIL